MTPNEACQISPNLHEANNPEVLTQVVTGHCQQHGLRDLKVCRCIAFHSVSPKTCIFAGDGSRAAIAIRRKVDTGELASRVKLYKFRQILMNCAVVPGGERENGNEATLIKSGERIRSHSLDKAPHQPKNTLVGICRNLAGFTRFAR